MCKYLQLQLFIVFQNRKSSSQSYPRHHPFTSFLALPTAILHPLHLPAAFPFPCSIKASLPGVWTGEEESLTQRVFAHGAAGPLRLLLTSFARVGYDD